MSFCFGCGSKFGFFRREHSCISCGRVHCSKCLTYKMLLPSSQVEQDVCKRCFDGAPQQKTSVQNCPKSYPPAINDIWGTPPAYPGGGITISKDEPPSQTDPDAEIRQRLDQLKMNDVVGKASGSSEKEIDERFAKLTGREPTTAKSNDIHAPRPKISEQEEIDRLMESATAEVNLEGSDSESGNQQNSDQDIEDRLMKLKGINPENVKKSEIKDDSSEDETEAAAKVILKALAEVRIDEKVRADGHGGLIDRKENKSVDELVLPAVPITPVTAEYVAASKSAADEEVDELPWCCICNNDATLRCRGCDDDLYCRRCYREGHSKYDFEDHITSPFKMKRKR